MALGRKQTHRPANDPPKARRTPAERRQARIDRLGRRQLDDAVNQEDLKWVRPDPFVDHPPATMDRHEFLAGLHAQLAPSTYFEIGVRFGESLALSRSRSIGVDPAYRIQAPLHCDLRTFVETSDDFFAREDGFAHFEGRPVDLAFIDGMHLSEYVLRDFINTEAHMAPGGVIVLDDVLPRNHLEAYRLRRTGPWAGDVYKVLAVLRDYRPDLTVTPVNTAPTGTAVITGLDPTSTVLREAYAEIEPRLTGSDPQVVPDDVLMRRQAVDPAALLADPPWRQ